MSITELETNSCGIKHTRSKLESSLGKETANMTFVVGHDILQINFHDFAEMTEFCEKHNFPLPSEAVEVFA